MIVMNGKQIILVINPFSVVERYTSDLNPVVSTSTEGGQIHFNLVAIRLMPTIHFDWRSTSSSSSLL